MTTATGKIGEMSGEVTGEISGEVTGEISGEVTGEINGEMTGAIISMTSTEGRAVTSSKEEAVMTMTDMAGKIMGMDMAIADKKGRAVVVSDSAYLSELLFES